MCHLIVNCTQAHTFEHLRLVWAITRASCLALCRSFPHIFFRLLESKRSLLVTYWYFKVSSVRPFFITKLSFYYFILCTVLLVSKACEIKHLWFWFNCVVWMLVSAICNFCTSELFTYDLSSLPSKNSLKYFKCPFYY